MPLILLALFGALAISRRKAAPGAKGKPRASDKAISAGAAAGDAYVGALKKAGISVPEWENLSEQQKVDALATLASGGTAGGAAAGVAIVEGAKQIAKSFGL
jgi:hypothetical protein